MGDDLDKTDIDHDRQLDAFELYHLIVENAERPSSKNGGPVLPAFGHALAGSAATATSKLLTYPLDLVIARLQVQQQVRKPTNSSSAKGRGEYSGLFDAVSKIYQHEGGLSAFYTGCATDVTKGIADSFLFFLAYTFLQQYELQKLSSPKKKLPIAKEIGIGILAGSFAKLITTPLQNIITRLQTAALVTAKSAESDAGLKKGDSASITQIARQIYKERGLKGFWAGYRLSVALTLNPSITFAVDNFLQRAFRAKNAGALVRFLIAALSKAIATAITYPFSVAKSRAQAEPHHAGVASQDSMVKSKSATTTDSSAFGFILRYSKVFALVNDIYQRDGLNALYSGLEAEVLKGFLSHGLTMMMKDRVHGSIIELYYLLLRTTNNWPLDVATIQGNASDLALEVEERAENIGITVVEGGKQAIRELQKKMT